MNRNNVLKGVIASGMILIMHSCGVPKVTTQESKVKLPATYTNSSNGEASTGKIKWKDFFEDQYLQQLIDSALVNNKELNILMQKVTMAQNEIQTRKGEYLPTLNLNAGADLDKVGEFTRNGAVEENLPIKEDTKFPEPFTNYKFGLYSTWEIDVWKKLRNAKKAAVMEYMASQEGKNYLVTNLVAEIAASYYELVALDNQLKNIEQNIEIQKNALQVVKLLKESARTTQLAVKRFEAEVQKNQSEIYNIKQEIVVAENKINFLVGRTAQPVLRSADNFMNTQPKVISVGLPADLLENRPDIKKAQLELESAKLNVKVAKANFYPSLGLKAGIGYEAFKPQFLLNSPESLLYSLAGEALMPLINRNGIKAQYKNASAKQIQAVYEYEQTILNAYTEVVNQLSNIDNLDQSFKLKNDQVTALNESIVIANQLFQSARADYMEILLTQRDALEAKTALIDTKEKQFLAVIHLYKALGGGWN
ncbi:TolC family protein [Flavobacterium luminosum]|uniref:TolC family protein n=1 Tax=Flavobacterium luminosum TaxID=2949086 RepID=A0ABT0TJS9_9FLAO|nr:TolC family protein [Flavobacterium sp. HXWNR70]MCL9807747.1 TolC family protein [Flavobacterium sp. HXWNR70]